MPYGLGFQVNQRRFKAHIQFMGVDSKNSAACTGSSGAKFEIFVMPVAGEDIFYLVF